MNMAITERIANEVTELHQFFERWFNGTIPKTTTSFARVTAVWPGNFSLINPDNSETHAESVMAETFDQHGSFPGLTIQITDLRVIAAPSGSIGVAVYTETHLDGGETDTRLCSATLFDDPSAPHQLQWLHIHESRHARTSVAP